MWFAAYTHAERLFCAALFLAVGGTLWDFSPIFPQIAEMEGILSTRNDETKELKVKSGGETCYMCRNAVFFGRMSNASSGLVILVSVELRVGTT